LEKFLLLGTKNPAKVYIVRAALEILPIMVLTLGDLNINLPVKEDGQTTEENAQAKARAYFAASQVPTQAIDGGLYVEKFPFDKQPEMLVRRIYGEDREATDEEVLEYFRRELEAVGGESAAIWRGAMTLMIAPENCFQTPSFLRQS